MATKELRDRLGNLLGTVETRSDGEQVLRDRQGNLKGTYNPTWDKTCDPQGELVAYGNILTTLL